MNVADLEHFGKIVQQTNDAIFSTDESFIIKTWNAATEKLYGFTAAEAVGQKLSAVLKTNITDEQRTRLHKELAEKGFYKDEYEIYDKNNQKLSVIASINVLREAGEGISGYVSMHHNNTEQKKVEQDLRSFNADLEDKVKQKTKQLTDIFERITDAFVALDTNWCYTYMNKKAGEILSCDPTAMIGKYVWTAFPEGVGQPFYYAYEKAMSEQRHIHVEAFYAPYQRWFENHIYPSAEGLSIFFRDITTYKQAEEQTKLSNQRLSLHLTNSPLAVVEWDVNLKITSWSNQAEAIFGWTKKEVVGKTVEELKLVYEEDVRDVSAVLEKLTTGEITSLKVVNKNNTKTGKIVTCEWYNSVLKDENGTIISCMSLVQDITERKKAEERLAVNEQQLSLIYNSGTDIVFLLGVEPDGRYKFITVNNAFKNATGLTSDQIVGKYVDEVIPSPSLELVLKKYKEAIETKRTVHWEEVTEYPAGTKTGLVSVTPICDSNNVCVRLVGSIHDITENKRAEAELKEKNEQLRSLSAYLQEVREEERAIIAREIHDELGERLTGIRLDVSWIENKLSSAAQPVKDKFPGLIQLIDDTIKTVRKIATELRPSILDDFGLQDALEWQAAEFEKRTGIKCSVKSDVKNFNNKKNDITLFRIFQESLTNVLRHSQAKSVCVQLTERNKDIELTIKDDGIGMDLNAVKSKRTLGLIGMKERILMANGKYNVASEIGKGTTITASVPNI